MMTTCTIVRMLLVNLCALLVIGFSYTSGQTTTSKNVICSYYSYSPQRPGVTSFTPSDIDPSICTHLEYHEIDAYKGKFEASPPGIDQSKALEEFQSLRLSNPSLKVIIGVDTFYPSLVSQSYEDRQIFINNMIDFVRTWDFSGLGLWFPIIAPEVVTFVEEMHAAFLAEAKSSGKEPLILMLSVSGWGGIGEGVDLQSLGQAIDILHATPYGFKFNGSYTFTTFLSPMYGSGGLYGNVSASVTDFLDAGIPPEKLHIGIGLQATTFRLLDSENTGVGAPANRSAERGEYTKQTDYVAYYEVCQRLQEENYTAEFDPEGLVNFAYKGDQWMTYEDPASLEIKMDYVYDHHLGGVVTWFLHYDDYTGQFCDQGPYPLVSTLYRLASRTITTTTTPPATTALSQTCSSGIVYKFLPDPYSCEHYRICVFGMLFRYKCLPGLSFDSEKGYCVKNPTTTCVTIPELSK